MMIDGGRRKVVYSYIQSKLTGFIPYVKTDRSVERSMLQITYNAAGVVEDHDYQDNVVAQEVGFFGNVRNVSKQTKE